MISGFSYSKKLELKCLEGSQGIYVIDSEYLKSKGTHKNYQVQLSAPCRTT